jgi:hypothetical protein
MYKLIKQIIYKMVVSKNRQINYKKWLIFFRKYIVLFNFNKNNNLCVLLMKMIELIIKI